MCTHNTHYLCPSKLFIRDDITGSCALREMTKDSKCHTALTPWQQVPTINTEVVGSRWLVNAPAQVATVTCDHHDVASRSVLTLDSLFLQ